MKISLALGNREELSRQTAHGCVGTNLALPGFGSLMAGRAVGYAQAALTVIGFVLTMAFGLKFIVWYLGNWSSIHSPQADPFVTLSSVLREVRWAVLGIGLFAVAWLWALGTNAGILRQVRHAEEKARPPKLM
jgi:hypothetical protein